MNLDDLKDAAGKAVEWGKEHQDDIKKVAEKAVEWGKEHQDDIKKGIDTIKDKLKK